VGPEKLSADGEFDESLATSQVVCETQNQWEIPQLAEGSSEEISGYSSLSER
jgi:hypothetical protein